MSLYKRFKTNKTSEVDGAWVEVECGDEINPKFKLARMIRRNKRYAKLMDLKMRPYKKALEHDVLPESIAEKALRESFVETILLDWRDVKDEDGNEIVFSKDTATKLLNDLPDLFDLLQEHARDMSLFKESELEAESKN